MGKKIEKGSKVTLHYTGTLEDGTEFDDSVKRDRPLEVEAGSGQLIKGFDSKLIGMEEGQEKEFVLKPEEAYGQRVEELVQEVPNEAFEGKFKPEVGMMLQLQDQNGQIIGAKITEVNEKSSKIDINHPLAGKVLKFKIKIVKVE